MSDEDVTGRLAEIAAEFRSPASSAPYQFCDRHPSERVAFRVVDGLLEESRLTYAQLAEPSRRIATVLHDAGVGPGDRVATFMGKSVDLPAASSRRGASVRCICPLFTAFAESAVCDRLTMAEAKVVVTDDAHAVKAPAGEWTVFVTGPMRIPGTESLDQLADRAPEWTEQAPAGPDVPLVHIFTSGTTGKPKTVVHPKFHAAGWCSYLEFGIGVTDEAVFWCGADPGWAYGL